MITSHWKVLFYKHFTFILPLIFFLTFLLKKIVAVAVAVAVVVVAAAVQQKKFQRQFEFGEKKSLQSHSYETSLPFHQILCQL